MALSIEDINKLFQDKVKINLSREIERDFSLDYYYRLFKRNAYNAEQRKPQVEVFDVDFED